jgi:hypothetical protein
MAREIPVEEAGLASHLEPLFFCHLLKTRRCVLVHLPHVLQGRFKRCLVVDYGL